MSSLAPHTLRSLLCRCRAATTAARLPAQPRGPLHQAFCRQLLRRVHTGAPAAAAADAATSPPPPPPQQPPSVDPPPTLPFSAEAANSVVLSGRVLSDPAVRHFPANQVAASVRLGLSARAWQAALPQQPYGAVTVDAWGYLALQLAQHVRKGDRLHVRGALKEETWNDRRSGERRWMVKVLADELALLAPSEEHPHSDQQHDVAAAAAPPPPPPPARQQPMQQAPAQQQQQQPPPQRRPLPRASASAEQSRELYEGQRVGLAGVSAARGLRLSTVTDHLLACAVDGRFTSWARLAADVRLGPPGGPLLSPAEVAGALADVQAEGGLDLQAVPLGAVRARLEATPAAAPKVQAMLQGSEPSLLYGAIKLVRTALEQGISFTALTSEAAASGGGGGRAPF